MKQELNLARIDYQKRIVVFIYCMYKDAHKALINTKLTETTLKLVYN